MTSALKRVAIATLFLVCSNLANSQTSNSGAGSPSTTLTKSAVQDVLATKLAIKTKVTDLPPKLKQSYSDYFGEPFFMASPGEPMNGCIVEPDVPNKRLVFAAVSDEAGVIVFEVGGYATLLQVAVFDFRQKTTFAARLHDYAIKDLQSLRAGIAEGHYHELVRPLKFRRAESPLKRSQ